MPLKIRSLTEYRFKVTATPKVDRVKQKCSEQNVYMVTQKMVGIWSYFTRRNISGNTVGFSLFTVFPAAAAH